MGRAVLQPQDCLKNSLHLGAFDFRPPQPSTKRHGKKKALSLSLPPPQLSTSTSASLKPRRNRPSPLTQTQPPPQQQQQQQHLKQRKLVRKKLACAAEKSADNAKTDPPKPLAMGEVRILKRGEDSKLSLFSLFAADRHSVDAAVGERSKVPVSASHVMGRRLMSGGFWDGSELSGSSSSSVDRQSILELRIRKTKSFGSCYAGAGFLASPAPISLPMPRFILGKSDRGGFQGVRAKV